jgi:glycerol-3-phosphate dehydrogenase|tara:strand:- start:2187 stop:3686 length:1500 start_codon:yes stop_codon:yes gene_type:complete
MDTDICSSSVKAVFKARTVDIAIIGGGVQGCALAAEAASRQLSTLLIEAEDIASGASSRSNRIIGGDLSQLEQLDVDAVNRGLKEQAILRQRAPHLVRSHIFTILPNTALRSRLRIQAGLYSYRALQRHFDLPSNSSPAHIIDAPYSELLSYCDDSVDDSRLTLALAQQARTLGANIRPHIKLLKATRKQDFWLLELRNSNGNIEHLHAKVLINAAGSASVKLMQDHIEHSSRSKGMLRRDDYLVISSPAHCDNAVVLQADNKQLIYLLDTPSGQHAVLGPWQSDNVETADASAAAEQLIALYNQNFKKSISADDIVHRFHALRCLCADSSCEQNKTSQDYALDLDNPAVLAPLLNSYGGNIGTHRLLAEQALTILQPFTGALINTELKNSSLPGGDFSGGLTALQSELKFNNPAIESTLLLRLARSYGCNSHKILLGITTTADLGQHFGADLYQREVEYLCSEEWAQSAEDILWRRSKLGLCFSATEKQALQAFISAG